MLKDVLIFDDSTELLETFSTIFSRHGYKARLAKNKLIFEEQLRFKKPDLILLDVALSGMDGREVCRDLKTNNTTKDIRIILISATPKNLENYQSYFADDILEKPFSIKELFSTIDPG